MPELGRYCLYLALVFSLLCEDLSAQSFEQKELYANSPLKAITIYNITQDQDGYIWLGTDEGMFRFDGLEYQQFTVSDGLADMEVFNLKIDALGHIFIINFSNRLNFYYQGKIYNESIDSKLEAIKLTVWGLDYHPADNAFIFAGERDAISYLKFSEGGISMNRKIPWAGYSPFLRVISNRNYWYLFYVNKKVESVYDVYDKTTLIKQGQLPFSIHDILLIDSIVYASSSEHPKSIFSTKFNTDLTLASWEQHEIDFRVKHLYNLQNELWLTSYEGGALHFDGKKIKEHLLPNKSINSLFLDRVSNLWVGTELEGLYFFQKNKMINLGIDSLRISKTILSLAAGKNSSVFVGFNKMMIGEIQGRQLTNQLELEDQGENNYRRVLKLAVLDNQRLFCGTDDGFFEINRNDNSVRRLGDEIGKAIKDFVIDQEGNFWIGNSGNLIFFEPQKDVETFGTIWKHRITTLHLDEQETLWIGTLQGLFFKRKESLAIQKFHCDGLDGIKIKDIESKGDVLLIATEFGLRIIAQDYSVNFWITKQQGLLSNQCRKVVIENDFLWIASSEGVAEIQFDKDDYRTLNVQTYTTFDGLLSNDINDLLFRNDTLWVATNKGLSILPLFETEDFVLPKTNIVSATTNLETHNIFKPIRLSPDKNSISISFSGMSFGSGNYDRYQYRLLPKVTDWSLTDYHSITFSELRPGAYTFEVLAIDHKKRTGETPASLDFIVEASFTQTTFFKILLGLLGLSIIAVVFYWREKQVARKIRFEKTVSSLELEAIKAQINPHFIYNSLNSIKNTILKKEIKNAEKQLSVFASLVRKTLHISQKNFIGLDQEIAYLNQYLVMEKIRFKTFLNFNLSCENIPEPDQVKVPTMLLQPFVENAIKHGVNPDNADPCKIDVRFIVKEETLFCEIEDNGPGLENVIENKNLFRKYMPQGILISSSRVKAYQTLYDLQIKIEIIDKNKVTPLENGVIIKIEIPIENENHKRNHY